MSEAKKLPKNWKNIKVIDVYDCNRIDDIPIKDSDPPTMKKYKRYHRATACNAIIGNTKIENKKIQEARIFCNSLLNPLKYMGKDVSSSKAKFYQENEGYSYQGKEEEENKCMVAMKIEGESKPELFQSSNVYIRKRK